MKMHPVRRAHHGQPEVGLSSFQLAFDKSLVDDHLRGNIGQPTSPPGFHLLPHRLEVPLHPINANRDAVDERERLGVLRKHRRNYTCDNVSDL